MSNEMRCGDPEALAGYLYGEIDPAEKDGVERHLAGCEICASEIEGLRGTRTRLAAWAPPEATLGFRIVSDVAETPAAASAPTSARQAARRPAPVATSPRWWRWTGVTAMPAWAQAAAAVMLFSGGALIAALMNMEVRYDQAGVTIRTGWQQADAPASAAQNVSAREISALESRMRAEFVQARSAGDSGKGVIALPQQDGQTALQTSPALQAGTASGDVMRQVRQIVAESEQRQQRELAVRLTQAVRELDTTHRADLDRIERTVSPMEEQQRQMLNYITRVSQQR